MTEKRKMKSTRCMETIDIEELLEWMLLNPVSHPDNGLLFDTYRAGEPVVTPRLFNLFADAKVNKILDDEGIEG